MSGTGLYTGGRPMRARQPGSLLQQGLHSSKRRGDPILLHFRRRTVFVPWVDFRNG